MREFYQFKSGEDWYTISQKEGEEEYEVSRQGNGNYSCYTATKQEVERLKTFATSEII